MSREAPPESHSDVRVPPPDAQHAALWLALPLVALALPVAYRLVVMGDLEDALRVRFDSRNLTRFWYAATFVSALVLMGFMAARRRGRIIWPAMDLVAGAFPWVVALAAQSMVGEPSSWDERRDLEAGASPWGLVHMGGVVIAGLRMCEARGVGALVAAALWAAAAVGLLLPHAEAPRWRGAGLVVVTLPAWGVAYGFMSSGNPLPFIGATLLSGVVLYAGTQESPAARSAARASVLLASLAAMALNVSAACETLVERPGFLPPDFFADHARLYDTLRAAKLSGIVLLIPAVLGASWLSRGGEPRASLGSRLLLVLAFVGILTLDQVGTRLALARVTPAAWPPWSGVDVTPLPLGDAAQQGYRRTEPSRFILADGELRDERGRLIARLADAAAVRTALASAPLALHVAPMDRALGERLAIVADYYDETAALGRVCPGRVVSVLIDRSITMPDLRAFVTAAVASGVVEVDVVGPSALWPEAKAALANALRAAGQEAAWPLGAEDELAFVAAARALPATGYAPVDIRRELLSAHTAPLPSPCWLAQLAAAPAEADEQALPGSDPTPPPAAEELGEVLREAPPDVEVLPRRTVGLWLDPSRDVGAFLLDVTSREHVSDTVIWTLEPSAP